MTRRERSCEGKFKWCDKATAKKAAKRMATRRAGLLPYRCEFCGFWHLGHRTIGYYAREGV